MNYGNPYASSINSNTYLQNLNQMQQQQPYGMNPQMQMPQAPMPQPQYPQAQPQNFDFQGNFVTSYEQAKNTPYSDKMMVYLDTANDRVYIKSINDKGVPETKVLGLVAIENTVSKETSTPQADLVNAPINAPNNNLEDDIKKIDEKYDKAISALKTQISELKKKEGK